MKKYFKYIFAIILFFILIVPNKVFATTLSEYTIESYDIDMVVNEDNTFEITERITAYFNVSKHGIYRKIPLRNSVTRSDGTKSNNIAKISNISVNENYTISKSNGYKVIKIGDSNKTYKGRHYYTIKYTYDIGKDKLNAADELYFNLIGDEWDTSISNVTFKITMPKSFDKSLLGFSSGNTGSTNSSNVSYSVFENVISGYLYNTLYPGQALTVRLTLPEGYFIGESSNMDIMYSIIVIIVSLIFVLIAYRLWAKYGKDEKVIETVEFYPPKEYNSAEVGLLYEGSADTKSVISLLIYLADKGYLKIEETEDKKIFRKNKGFRIIKIKEYDGNNEYEKLFFKGLFKGSKKIASIDKARKIIKESKNNGEKISFQNALEMSEENDEIKTSVTEDDLYNNFYRTLNEIKSKLNSKENRNKIFELSAIKKSKWLIMMIIAIFTLITIKPVLEYEEPLALVFALLFPGIGLTVSISALIGKTNTSKIFLIIWGIIFGGIPGAIIILPALIQNVRYIAMYIIGIICISIIVLFAKIMPKRTPYGNEMLGKLKGFKRFLETAEKPQLEALVNENPEYFYNILPYTYALGVSEVWINQFETIALQAPNWYDATDDFNIHTFGTFMTSTMTSASSAMTSTPSSDGGDFSGGGFSGGGSGGGGGGSW